MPEVVIYLEAKRGKTVTCEAPTLGDAGAEIKFGSVVCSEESCR